MKKYPASIYIFLILSNVSFPSPTFNYIKSNSDTIALYDKFELTIDLSAQFLNPFDPNQINLKAIFISPTSKEFTVYGFYYQDYIRSGPPETLKVNGQPVWKIRFTPNEIGKWSYKLSCTDTTGTFNDSTRNFLCIASQNRGFIRKSNNNYFKYDDGSQFFAIGLNLGWYDSLQKTFSYQKWMDELSVNGGNYFRAWMAHWNFAIEWNNTGLGNYTNRLERAYQLDWILDYAKEKGIYIQLCLVPHGHFSTTTNPEWHTNPYNYLLGCPCKEPSDFFTNQTAKNYFKGLLRYIISRWGYSPNLMAWELFNEVDFVDNYNAKKIEVSNWLIEMANFIKALDPTQRMVTTSYANEFLDNNIWSLQQFDFTQIHHYNTTSDVQSVYFDLTNMYLNDYSKPVSVGEFDFLDWGNWASFNDPRGVNLHNSLWASAMSGAFGTASTWSWDVYVEPRNLWIHFKPLSEFMKSINL
ncbi:MAG: DUF5060 domain-containing protein, partial [Ignavibacteria bacterium]|nr:DUF5060 domain-containing protein [Ignavibacteria bacterium]